MNNIFININYKLYLIQFPIKYIKVLMICLTGLIDDSVAPYFVYL